MMKKEEIEKILDEIDIIMANNLNEKNNIEDANVINNLSNKICDIQNIMINNQKKVESNLKNRFRITATAIQYITANNKNNINQEDLSEANKYFRWLNNEKENATKTKLSYNEALTASKYAIDSGHEENEKTKEILNNTDIKKNDNAEKYLKKQTWFDKLRSKISNFLNKNIQNKNITKEREKVNRNKHNEFVLDLNKDNFKSQQPFKDEVLVISDLHGNLNKWQMVKNTLNDNPKRKLIIEGDAMDRGQFGVEILMQIKELCDQGRAEYLPGNHDVFAYNYLATKGSMFEDTITSKNAKENWTVNGGKITLAKFEDDNYRNIMETELKSGRINKGISKDSLIEWLGNCPIQKKIQENGKSYALSHAMFDEELYEKYPNFNLRKALEMELEGKKEDKEILDKFNNCMWYRENDNKTHWSDISWPKGSIVVVGHTRQTEANLKYLGDDPSKPMIYLDCGKGKLQGFNLSDSKHESIEENATKGLSNNRER